MGHILGTAAGNYRANWRDPTGRQRAKTFDTKRAAREFLAGVETAKATNGYVDPHAGRLRLLDYAERWAAGHAGERATRARDASLLRTHVLPKWGDWPLSHIEHSAVQQWVTELAGRKSPATVQECLRLLKLIMASAVRDRLLIHNPCDSVRAPRCQAADVAEAPITRAQLRDGLLPAMPARYRLLAALAAGCGLRWGEAAGLAVDAVDERARTVRVVRVVEEVDGALRLKPYPKSEAGRRTVPIPPFVLDELSAAQAEFPVVSWSGVELLTSSTAGTPLSRSVFRARVWRPALVKAGLLGSVEASASGSVQATWRDPAGERIAGTFPSHAAAVAEVARLASGGLRFHDLRHAYATWLVSEGVPVNVVQRVMGHSSASTTLNLYVHPSRDHDDAVRGVFG